MNDKNNKDKNIKIKQKNQMFSANEDKKLLIESMKKLTHHISNNTQRQKDIFRSLSKKDLQKIIINLQDENQYLRRISALLLCELLYHNNHNKYLLIQMLNIKPQQGRICLNKIPQYIYKTTSILTKCLELMKSSLRKNQDNKICWIINIDRKNLNIQFFDYKKYSSFTFFDPARNIFGFTYIKIDSLTTSLTNNNNTNKNRRQRSIERNSLIHDARHNVMNQSSITHNNNSFYKNYMEVRNHSRDSNSYIHSHQKKQKYKPTSQLQSQHHKDTNQSNLSEKKNMQTIQSISQYARDSYSRKSKNRQSEQFHHVSHTINQFNEQNTNDGNHLVQKYRKSIHNNNDINGSVTQRYPQSAKNSYANQNEKFYKRVKEILKR